MFPLVADDIEREVYKMILGLSLPFSTYDHLLSVVAGDNNDDICKLSVSLYCFTSLTTATPPYHSTACLFLQVFLFLFSKIHLVFLQLLEATSTLTQNVRASLIECSPSFSSFPDNFHFCFISVVS